MPGGGFGKIYITTALINAISSTVNGALSRKQQRELALQNQKFTSQMEQNRQQFQLRINQENIRTQHEMSEKNHQLRLLEQRSNFELMCKSAEWQHFLNDWPLRVQPSVLRQEQILDDGTIALRVFFAKSSNKFFSGYIYPKVEQGLLEFIDCYHNVFGSHNIVFYHNAYRDNIYGGAINANIRYALKELPVIIIDSNVLNEEICVSLTIWGFGNANEQHATVFKLPYKIETKDGQVDLEYVNALSDQLLAYLKFVLGYAYDTYNLIMYNKVPLLPSVAQYELDNPSLSKSSPLRFKGIMTAFGEQYRDIYTTVLGSGTSVQSAGFAERPESFKRTVLHVLRLEYANSIREFVEEDEYQKYLDESIIAWCELRTEDTASDFISKLLGNSDDIIRYFSIEDVGYFTKLCDSYKTIMNIGDLCSLCMKLEQHVIENKDKIINNQYITTKTNKLSGTNTTPDKSSDQSNDIRKKWIEL